MLIARLVVGLSLLALASCAGTRQYGTFLDSAAVQTQSFFSIDAAAQLRRAYSPAEMPLAVPDAQDPFGQEFVTRLRSMGFAVSDEGSAAPANALIVRYVVAGIGTQFYRVSLVIWRARDSALLSRMNRAYGQRDGVMHPAGPWTRQVAATEEE